MQVVKVMLNNHKNIFSEASQSVNNEVVDQWMQQELQIVSRKSKGSYLCFAFVRYTTMFISTLSHAIIGRLSNFSTKLLSDQPYHKACIIIGIQESRTLD